MGHKGTFNSDNVKTDEYSNGGADWTPIMGNNLATDRTIWAQSYVALGGGNYASGNNDISVLTTELGLRADDHGASTGTSTNVGSIGIGQSLLDTGLLTTILDKDVFKFQVTAASSYSILVEVADVGANLDSTLQLLASDGSVIATSSPDGNLDASLFRSLAIGTYYAKVGSQGVFTGDLGRYALRVVQVGLPVFTFTSYPVDNSIPSIGIAEAFGGADDYDHGAESIVQTPQQPASAPSATPETDPRLRAWDAALAQWELHGSGQRGKAQAILAAKVESLDEVLGLLGTARGPHV